MSEETRDVPHIEIRRTDVRKVHDAAVTVENTKSVLPLLREILQGKEQESFVILILDGYAKVSAWREVARGTANQVQVPVREMFRTALAFDAHALILSHNHPAGDPTPSQQDIGLTQRVREAGELLNCPILDHIIIGDGNRYHSFAERHASRASHRARGDPLELLRRLVGLDGGDEGNGSLPTDGKRQPPELDD